MLPAARQTLCAAAAAAAVGCASAAFVLPGGGLAARAGALPIGRAGAAQEPQEPRSFGAAAAVALIGAHAGLAAAMCGRTARRAEGKYTESAVDAKLFEQVYLDYTTEYLKGPMYAHREKAQGARPDYPGNPLYKNGKMTSNVTGNLKTFSSNELMYLSMLFFGIGLYGNLQFLYFDPQFPRVDSGLNFNVSYIVESLFLPMSFFFHIACYIQRKNGK
ncbi:unnamed protein product [Prorocentrum cordatum]|uniref:Derlin n=1 Tax=Prorocentrum cordatum TaxID=2364126 RepID=A0ABN9PV19_9DINO|nr:unnamed protein product [Polarella glacialis]